MVAASAPDSFPTNAAIIASAPQLPKKADIADRVADLLVCPSGMKFKDFEMGFKAESAVQDYCNVFAPFGFLNSGFDEAHALRILRPAISMGIPPIADYFCIKMISWGFSMDPEAVLTWREMPVEEKAAFVEIFVFRHLSSFDWLQSGIIDLVEQDAYFLNLLFRGTGPNANNPESCRNFIDIVTSVCTRATKRMRILDNPELMREEIEKSMKP